MINRPNESKAKEIFGEVCVDKSLMDKSGLRERSIPSFVGEWIIDRYCKEGEFSEEVKNKIRSFIDKHLPSKDQKDIIKNRLSNGEAVVILDNFMVTVDLKRDRKILHIPCIDERGFIENYLVDRYPNFLRGGIWGAGKLCYHSPSSENKLKEGEIWMVDFKPMQVFSLDLDFYINNRSRFSLPEWRELLINSMGTNPSSYLPEQQLLLIARLVPLVQPRANLIELSPKGTGKSFIYSNLSRYVRMVSGGKITAAVLFYNNATNTPGLLTRYDVVVLDEAQTISFDNPGEVIGVFKDYLESGRYSRGKQEATADCDLVLLGNIQLTSDLRPKNPILFLNLPKFLQETAFIDRLHGIIPGWKLPRITKDTPARDIGFKADYFSEVLHALRQRTEYNQFIARKLRIVGTKDMRDKKAIERLAEGFLKLLFPDLKATDHELLKYCFIPAANLRQRIRDQLSKMDAEFKAVEIGVEVQS